MRHCVRLLTLVSTDLLAVRVSSTSSIASVFVVHFFNIEKVDAMGRVEMLLWVSFNMLIHGAYIKLISRIKQIFTRPCPRIKQIFTRQCEVFVCIIFG